MPRLRFRMLGLSYSLILVSLCLFGCSQGKEGQGPRGKVAGKVTHAGDLVGPATIFFENVEAGVALAVDIGHDGSYEVRTYKETGLPVGTYKVAVTPGTAKAPTDQPLAGDAAPQPTTSAKIPEKFHSTATSGLQVEVKEGNNPPFHFDLSR